MFHAHLFSLNLITAAAVAAGARASSTKTTTIKGWSGLVRRAPLPARRAGQTVWSNTVL